MISSSTIVFDLIQYVLGAVGYWMLFGKCGAPRWHALVPFLRNYTLSACADDRDNGKIWLFSSFVMSVLAIGSGMVPFEKFSTLISLLFVVVLMTFVMIHIVYSLRVYAALCVMFHRRKAWLILWFLAPDLALLIWGIRSSFQPEYHVGERRGPSLSNASAAVLAEGLTVNLKDYTVREGVKRHTILRDLHFSIPRGHMVLLLGGSGAGKSCLVSAVTGYERANAVISLDGEDVYRHFNRMKNEIGFVPQQDLIRYQDTVYHTVADAAVLRLPHTCPSAQRRARVDEVLDIFGLAPVRDGLVQKQSGGQKKRISIATEFIADPSLYILDEPDSGLDGILARDLMRRLHDISRRGKIVLVITHTPDRVLEFFDDVIVLAKDREHTGRLVFCGSVAEAKDFFGCDTMEGIVRAVNRTEEGGEGRADELIEKFGGLQNEAC